MSLKHLNTKADQPFGDLELIFPLVFSPFYKIHILLFGLVG